MYIFEKIDLFHWSCFNEFQKKIPSSKLPSAYLCPKCKLSVFPPENTISPVADVVRKKLETVNWARNVFNLGLVSFDFLKNFCENLKKNGFSVTKLYKVVFN